jgi:hypothetical protein
MVILLIQPRLVHLNSYINEGQFFYVMRHVIFLDHRLSPGEYFKLYTLTYKVTKPNAYAKEQQNMTVPLIT